MKKSFPSLSEASESHVHVYLQGERTGILTRHTCMYTYVYAYLHDARACILTRHTCKYTYMAHVPNTDLFYVKMLVTCKSVQISKASFPNYNTFSYTISIRNNRDVP
jgi:hypothetical protein